jgi:hypothetical protein
MQQYGDAGHHYPHRYQTMAATYHTYADLIIDGGRLAATEWPKASIAEAINAKLAMDCQAIVLTVVARGEITRGYAPGGMATI